jgi:hypothetical protein
MIASFIDHYVGWQTASVSWSLVRDDGFTSTWITSEKPVIVESRDKLERWGARRSTNASAIMLKCD